MALRARELDLRERELERGGAETERSAIGVQGWVSLTAVLVSLLAVWQSGQLSKAMLDESQRQFQATIAETRYAGVVDGLTSDSVSVRAGAIGRLYDYATTAAGSRDEKDEIAVDAAQLLALLIQEESGDRPREGLAPFYELPSPLITRAFARLRQLMQYMGEERMLMDVSRSDFHGLSLPALQGFWNGAGSDFRGSFLASWDLEGGYFAGAFFTCADLRVADLGRANVSSTDFTGADLRGTDLSEVTDLTSEQLVGAQVGPETRLPPGVAVPLVDGKSASPAECTELLRDMTGLPLGFGYTSTHSCTGASRTGPICSFRLQGET